jgi:hypothetical protein
MQHRRADELESRVFGPFPDRERERVNRMASEPERRGSCRRPLTNRQVSTTEAAPK